MESPENQTESEEPEAQREAHEEVQPEDFENDPARNPDDPELKAMKGG
jgi:hypothetical protein